VDAAHPSLDALTRRAHGRMGGGVHATARRTRAWARRAAGTMNALSVRVPVESTVDAVGDGKRERCIRQLR